jgi:hypothetical protein
MPSTQVGLAGCVEWVPDEVRECAGGVGGRSGPAPFAFSCVCDNGADSCDPEGDRCDWVSILSGCAPRWGLAVTVDELVLRGCGRTLCFLNDRWCDGPTIKAGLSELKGSKKKPAFVVVRGGSVSVEVGIVPESGLHHCATTTTSLIKLTMGRDC